MSDTDEGGMIMWKQKDKYKECCHNDACESFDTCIECWDEFAERNPSMTNADRIRAMSDEELAVFLCGISTTNCCGACMVADHCYTDHNGFSEWLKQPAE